MTQVVDQLARITGFRDRDQVDAMLVVSLRELLAPRQLTIYRCVGQPPDRRWLMRARLGPDDLEPVADPLWVAFEDLPPIDQRPNLHQVLLTQQPVSPPAPMPCQVFPLQGGREADGVLEIITDEPLDAATERLISGILRVYRNFLALLDDSERDMLTGLLNRKTFDDAFYRILAQPAAAEPPAPPSAERRHTGPPPQPFIGVVDIDHFKRVNDSFGHLIGDEVLLLLSRLMRACFRFDDRLYRFGGEEFVVLLRCASDADAGMVFERLRARVAAHVFPQVGAITISVGYAAVRPVDTPGRAFERADQAVYWVKAHGRNQVCSHAELVARGDLADDAKVGDVELF